MSHRLCHYWQANIDAPDVMVIHIRAVRPGEDGPDESDAVQGPPSVTVHV